MLKSSKIFYIFAGVHSFLIGLFLFFIPVFLWKQGFGLTIISLFVSLLGIGYLGALWIWDRIRKKISFSQAITLSLLCEIACFSSIFLIHTSFGWILLGVLHGIYNGLFWTLQRTLFLETITNKNSGRKYGNFQIFIFLILKISIFIGSFLLEKSGTLLLFALSTAIALLGIWIGLKLSVEKEWKTLQSHEKLSLKNIQKTPKREQYIFMLDGPFLFFESFFWSLSLFWILEESFLKLGILVIILSLLFTVVFWVVKNIIDRIQTLKNYIYGLAVVLYALSWAGRSLASESMQKPTLFILLFGIMFGTSFFRLLFNKRFFDNAQKKNPHHYIYKKSYYSQASIVVVFSLIAGIFVYQNNPIQTLPILYIVAGGFSLFYGFYTVKK